MHDPEVLILDEPTLGLDPAQIRETRHLIRELGERHTVLLSSHILHEVEQICGQTIIIASGRIVASGSTRELRDQFTAQARVIAEMRGPMDDVEKGVRALDGVQNVEASSVDGWIHLTVQPKPKRDIREDLFRLTAGNGWSLREIRLEGATLEDFFVQVTAQQLDGRGTQRASMEQRATA